MGCCFFLPFLSSDKFSTKYSIFAEIYEPICKCVNVRGWKKTPEKKIMVNWGNGKYSTETKRMIKMRVCSQCSHNDYYELSHISWLADHIKQNFQPPLERSDFKGSTRNLMKVKWSERSIKYNKWNGAYAQFTNLIRNRIYFNHCVTEYDGCAFSFNQFYGHLRWNQSLNELWLFII